MNCTTESNAEIRNMTTPTQWTNVALSLENQTFVLLWKIWPPVLLLLGGFGNIATIFVMRRIKDNNSSQHVILMALAVSDFSSLYFGLLREWLSYLFHLDIYTSHVVVCKVCWWLIYATSTTSSWLLTLVTIQRTMAVKWPHKIRMMCSLRRTSIVVAAVVAFGCTLHFHFMFGMVISDHNECIFRSTGYEDFVLHVWAWIDLTVFTLVPSVCLLICNVILSLTLFKTTSSTSMTMSTTTNSNSSHINISRRRTASRTTVMILTLSCTFLALTMPVCVYHILESYEFADPDQDTGLVNKNSVEVAVTVLLWYTNSAINFLLYCFTGTRFRGEFLRWICCDGQVHSISNSSSGYSRGKETK